MGKRQRRGQTRAHAETRSLAHPKNRVHCCSAAYEWRQDGGRAGHAAQSKTSQQGRQGPRTPSFLRPFPCPSQTEQHFRATIEVDWGKWGWRIIGMPCKNITICWCSGNRTGHAHTVHRSDQGFQLPTKTHQKQNITALWLRRPAGARVRTRPRVDDGAPRRKSASVECHASQPRRSLQERATHSGKPSHHPYATCQPSGRAQESRDTNSVTYRWEAGIEKNTTIGTTIANKPYFATS